MALSAAVGSGTYLTRPYQPISTTYSRPFSGNSFGSSQEYNFRMIPHDLMKSEPSILNKPSFMSVGKNYLTKQDNHTLPDFLQTKSNTHQNTDSENFSSTGKVDLP